MFLQTDDEGGAGVERLVEHQHHLVLAFRHFSREKSEGETLGGGHCLGLSPLENLGGKVKDGLDELQVVVAGLQVNPLGEGDEGGPVLGGDLLLLDPEQEGDDPVLLQQPAD